jgi:hypothetical protein
MWSRNNVSHRLRITPEFDGPDHHPSGHEEGIFAAGSLDELAQADGPAGPGHIDHLGVVDDAVALERLLSFTGKSVPAAAGGCGGNKREFVPGRTGSTGGGSIQERKRGNDGHDKAEHSIA